MRHTSKQRVYQAEIVQSFEICFYTAMEWKDHVVKSDGFDNPHGHQNPHDMPVDSYTKEAKFVQVGTFALSKGNFML